VLHLRSELPNNGSLHTVLSPTFLIYSFSRASSYRCIRLLHSCRFICLPSSTPRGGRLCRSHRTAPTSRSTTGLYSRPPLETLPGNPMVNVEEATSPIREATSASADRRGCVHPRPFLTSCIKGEIGLEDRLRRRRQIAWGPF
jgi:hypothetical protein